MVHILLLHFEEEGEGKEEYTQNILYKTVKLTDKP